MNRNNSILNIEYRLRVRTILDNYPLMQSLNQLLQVFRKYNIKFFSKEDVQRIHKLADPLLKRFKLETVMGYLDLACVQTSQNIKYFVIKVRVKPKKAQKNKTNPNPEHEVSQCVQVFKKIMYQLYGKQINWFKAIGGTTISIRVDRNVCERNLSKILKHTCHSECGGKITSYFLQGESVKEVQWSKFMKIMREGNQTKHTKSLSYTGYSTIKSPQRRSFHRDMESFSVDVGPYSQNRTLFHDRPEKKFTMPLQSKKCKLYSRQLSTSPLRKKSSIQEKRKKSFMQRMELLRTTNTWEHEKKKMKIYRRNKTIS